MRCATRWSRTALTPRSWSPRAMAAPTRSRATISWRAASAIAASSITCSSNDDTAAARPPGGRQQGESTATILEYRYDDQTARLGSIRTGQLGHRPQSYLVGGGAGGCNHGGGDVAAA